MYFRFKASLLRRSLHFGERKADDETIYIIGKSDEFREGKMKVVDVDGSSFIVVRVDGQLCAVENQCAHLGVPLEGGKIEDGAIVCPFHNSKFDLCTGENLDWTPGIVGIPMPGWTSRLLALGMDPKDIPSYPISEKDGEVYLTID